MFSVVFVSLLFVGSSVAETNSKRMTSLRVIHSHIAAYVGGLSLIYHGYNQLQGKKGYMEYMAYDETLEQAVTTMTHNERLPSFLQGVNVPDPKQVIIQWTTKAVEVIDECIADIDKFIRNSDGGTIVGDATKSLLEETRIVMDVINKDPEVIDEQKRSKCPIYEHLEGIILMHGAYEQYKAFQQLYGDTVE